MTDLLKIKQTLLSYTIGHVHLYLEFIDASNSTILETLNVEDPPKFHQKIENDRLLYYILANKVIIEKSCSEVPLLEQDTIENVS